MTGLSPGCQGPGNSSSGRKESCPRSSGMSRMVASSRPTSHVTWADSPMLREMPGKRPEQGEPVAAPGPPGLIRTAQAFSWQLLPQLLPRARCCPRKLSTAASATDLPEFLPFPSAPFQGLGHPSQVWLSVVVRWTEAFIWAGQWEKCGEV